MFLLRSSSSRASSSSCQWLRCCSSATPFPVLKSPSQVLSDLDPKYLSLSRDLNVRHLDHVALCQAGGGDKGIQRHTQKNKKILVRDRILALTDPDTPLLELGTTAGLGLEYGDVPCAGVVTAIAKIRGVHVMIVANDGTVKGGSTYPIGVTKSVRAQELAGRLGIPTLYIVDTGGAFLPLQSQIFPDVKHGGRTFRNQAVMSSEGLPQLALVSGLCTAGGAYTPTMSDEAVIVHRIGNIYLGGPPLVKAATGEVVTGEELGGATLHCSVSGITDHFAQDEQESFQIIQDVVSSLNITEAEEKGRFDEPRYDDSDLLDTIAGKKRIEKSHFFSQGSSSKYRFLLHARPGPNRQRGVLRRDRRPHGRQPILRVQKELRP